MTARGWIAVGTAIPIGAVIVFAVGSRSGPPGEGQALIHAKRYAEAAEKFEQVVAADPKNDTGWYQLASARRQSGDCDKALVAYRRYVELVPAQNNPYYGIGLCLEKKGDRAGALVSLRRFVANANAADSQYVGHARTLIAALESTAATAAAPTDDPEKAPLLTQQALAPELRKLVDAAHAHAAVVSLEAAGCDLALVMTGADYNRFADLRYKMKMPAQVDDPRQQVVYCQRRTPTPPDCAELAPIFARVARPNRPFQVLSGYVDPPFSPRCAGVHDVKGKLVSGEGPGYASGR